MNENWKFYTSTEEAWEAIYKACLNAKNSIDFEAYMLDDDRIGNKFIKLLSEKSQKGIRVRLLLDSIGSRKLYLKYPINKSLFKGINLRFFNILNPLRKGTFGAWFFRDHRRIMVIDSEISFIGGICIDSDMKKWRDTQVSIHGKIMDEFKDAFEKMWNMSLGGNFVPPDAMLQKDNSSFKLYTNAPHRKQRFLYNELVKKIKEAKKSIYITTPYFLPEHNFFELLQKKAKEGLDIKVLVGTRSDHPLADLIASTYFASAILHGVNIFKFRKTIIHAKSCVIDESWASVGSMNMDSLSLLFNHEASLVSTNKIFVHELKTQFEKDIVEAEYYGSRKIALPFKTKLREIALLPLYLLFRIVGLTAYLLAKLI